MHVCTDLSIAYSITRFAASGSDIGNLSFVHWNYLSVGPVRCFTYDPPDVSPTGMDYKVSRICQVSF